ncbi:MAG: replication-associated recombination protein A [Pseudomonadota bacterium]
MSTTFFSTPLNAPLAEKLRPKSLDEVNGQAHLLGTNGPISTMVKENQLSSMILWGEPGCGKTTIARLLVQHHQRYVFEAFSAVFSGINQLKTIFSKARQIHENGQQMVLFVDEIHRFNRAQQDSFLHIIEDGSLILIGATTENPGFEINNALLSRLQVFVLKRLDAKSLESILERCENFMQKKIPLTLDAKNALISMSDGDGRYLINQVEILYNLTQTIKAPLDKLKMLKLLQKRAPSYDKSSEQHYNLISALHKSLRGSDCDGALYWLARMLDGGEDPHYILRRLLRFAYEDIGLADPQAPLQAIASWQTYERLGSPEGDLALVQLVIYLACAPKSNSSYKAMKQSLSAAQKHGSLAPPDIILNAPHQFLRHIGRGAGYQYDHDMPDHFSGQNYFPDHMARAKFYNPSNIGFERDLTKRLEYWNKLREKRQNPPQPQKSAPSK